MTETNFGRDWMVTETRVGIIKKPASSGRKLVPVSSAQVLENYLKELEAIEKKLRNEEIITQTKMRRVLLRRNQLKEQLIPGAQMKLGIPIN